MNKIITLPSLTTQLAEVTGLDKSECENFVLHLTRIICDALAGDGSVKVAGLGVFAVNEMRDKVVFTPDKALGARINAPFEIFEPELLAPEATPQMLGMAPEGSQGKTLPDGPPIFYDFFFSHE